MDKDAYIRFRLTSREKQLIQDAAASLDMEMSEFIRALCLNAAYGVLKLRGSGDDEFRAADEIVSMALKVKAYKLGVFDESGD